jgi:hypothetical protein
MGSKSLWRSLLKQVVNSYPQNAVAFKQLGDLYALEGNQDKAQQCMETAIQLQSNWLIPISSLAQIQLTQGHINIVKDLLVKSTHLVDQASLQVFTKLKII